ncbi:methyl-accepting chemotaxis protein [Marinobacterium lutimaris]|uniref:Methyl-accepting chemotaxis sensory transducer with Cache sensor n=1 Tax=Marinobacterium lutimaris TaxID=568106 RepID=A0A1H5ZEU4_9GAMM|nr:methyl-accepting chemotaxis protein [Marinobacterium lutimaris]SEG34147.1 methyl-accepting chemotaxis sensory transducer with Cache sensor [Marinobacterium lutimaris]
MRIRLKGKILLFALLPMLLVTLVVMLVVNFQMKSVGEREVEAVREELIAKQKEELKAYIDLALTAVAPIVASQAPDAKERAKDVLRSMTFGEDGYLFVYDFNGITVAYHPDPSSEGTDRSGVVDPDGVRVVKELIDKARSGGGFLPYGWMKPSVNAVMPKLSYADQIREWGWMVGTGVYIDDIDAAVAERQQAISKNIADTMWTIIGISVVLLLVVSLLSWFVANLIVNPIRKVAAALAEISQGEGDLTQRLPDSSQDEVGDLARGFNGFAANIQGVIAEVKGAVASLTQSTEQLDGVAGQTRSDAEQQKQETDQVAAAIHEMAAAVLQVSGSAAQAAEAAQEADRESGDGQAVVEKSISSINELADDVNRAAEVIRRLDEDSNEIGSIVSVIQGIAEQTNLLALNAAIEAARAGDHGRGFAVVADEVRSLSARTQQSTEEIHRMIERLQKGAQEAVKVMEAGQSQSRETVDTAELASESLNRIAHSVGLITEMNTQIASAAEEQTAVADEVSRSVQEIADISERSTRNAVAVADMSATMAQIEQRLATLVNRFKV